MKGKLWRPETSSSGSTTLSDSFVFRRLPRDISAITFIHCFALFFPNDFKQSHWCSKLALALSTWKFLVESYWHGLLLEWVTLWAVCTTLLLSDPSANRVTTNTLPEILQLTCVYTYVVRAIVAAAKKSNVNLSSAAGILVGSHSPGAPVSTTLEPCRVAPYVNVPSIRLPSAYDRLQPFTGFSAFDPALFSAAQQVRFYFFIAS